MAYNEHPYNTVPYNGPAPPDPLEVTSATFDIVESTAPAPTAPHFPANTTTIFDVQIRDRHGRLKAEVRDYLHCSWKRTWWDGNSFRLIVPGRIDGEVNPVIKHLRHGNFLHVWLRETGLETPLPSSVQDGEFLGFIEYAHGSVRTDEDVWEVRGGPLFRHRVIDPPNPGDEADENTGTFETLMRDLVNRMFGTAAANNRRVPRIQLAPDQGRGGTIEFSSRYDNLLTKISEEFRKVNLGWELRPKGGADGLVFVISAGVDRSVDPDRPVSPITGVQAQPVIFAPEMVNIEEQSLEWSTMNRATFAFMGGQGEGAQRNVQPVGLFAFEDHLEPTALFFEGKEARVEIPVAATSRGLAAITIEGWFYLDEDLTDNPIFCETIPGSTAPRLRVAVLEGRRLHLGFDTIGFDMVQQITLGHWTWLAGHIDFAANSVKLRAYDPIDQFNVTETFSPSLGSSLSDTDVEAIFMGHDPHLSTNQYLQGRLAQWRIWGSFLSDSLGDQVREQPNIFDDVAGPNNLRHYWRFDDAVGIWVRDEQGNEDGEISGAVSWVTGPEETLGEPVGLKRSEVFWDARDVETTNGLVDRAIARFREQGPKARFECVILPTGPYRYRAHFDLGDVVTHRNADWNASVNLRIVEIEVSLERGRNPTIRLSMGSPIPDLPAQINRGFRNVDPELRR